jgi:hypothetical protein
MASNETALCEQVIALFEKRLGAARADVTFPERDGGGPPVECRLRIGAAHFAFEHTLIEPFEKHIHSAVDFAAFAAPLRAVLDGTMPGPGTYKLFFDLHPVVGVPRAKHGKLRAKIETWVTSAAAELAAQAPARRTRDWAPHGDQGQTEADIDGVRVVLTRHVSWRQSGVHDGRIFMARLLPNGVNIETLRTERVERALEAKRPKLAACAALGDQSVLILEWNDFSLSNEVLIADALRPLLEERSDCPAHVFLADTTVEDDWDMHVLVEHGIFVFDP